jgi:hypothetical protein
LKISYESGSYFYARVIRSHKYTMSNPCDHKTFTSNTEGNVVCTLCKAEGELSGMIKWWPKKCAHTQLVREKDPDSRGAAETLRCVECGKFYTIVLEDKLFYK